MPRSQVPLLEVHASIISKMRSTSTMRHTVVSHSLIHLDDPTLDDLCARKVKVDLCGIWPKILECDVVDDAPWRSCHTDEMYDHVIRLLRPMRSNCTELTQCSLIYIVQGVRWEFARHWCPTRFVSLDGQS